MGAFLATLGWILWGKDGVVLLFIWGVILVALQPTVSPLWIMRLYGARALRFDELPALSRALEALARRADLAAVPNLHYVPSRVVNAFAVGRTRHSAIAITDGFLRALDTREQIAVLAHELSHIRSNDMHVMGLADLFGRLTRTLSVFGQILLVVNLPLMLTAKMTISWTAIVILIFAPSLSALAQLGLSRAREYDADLNAVRLTGDPQGLARALVKIERVQGGWIERLLLPGRRVPEPSLLRTHPPTEERVRRLLALLQPLPATPGEPLHPGTPRDFPCTHPVRHGPRWHLNGLWY